ncbi:MAG: winged helix-turn-helix domain-containing protein [Pirellulaceae bacterium]
MLDERSSDVRDAAIAHVVYLRDQSVRRERVDRTTRRNRPFSYRMKLGRETIFLGTIEYRIIRFLSSRPYRAYTRRCIAEAVSTCQNSVREETLDKYVASLRDKLGFFGDYIQTVPYIGYRFKA